MHLHQLPARCTFINSLQDAPSSTPCNMHLHQLPARCTFISPYNMYLHEHRSENFKYSTTKNILSSKKHWEFGDKLSKCQFLWRGGSMKLRDLIHGAPVRVASPGGTRTVKVAPTFQAVRVVGRSQQRKASSTITVPQLSKNSCLLWNTKVHSLAHNSTPLLATVSHVNPRSPTVL